MKPVFDSLENFFGLVAVRAEALGETHAWRVGKWIKNGALSIHEAMLRSRTRFAASQIDDELLRVLRSSNSMVAPKFPHSYGYFGRVMRIAEELRQGYVTSQSGTKVDLAEISWRDGSVEKFSSSSRFHFHALKWVIDLLDGYELTGDPIYVERSKELAAKWISECLYTETWPHVWDDHGTALRALAFCRLWTVLRVQPAEPSFIRQLLDAILRHAEKLSRKPFYRADHNHGVTQAYALLAIGLLLHGHSMATRWAKLGCLRLERQMSKNVSSDGLHLEHSPYYHFYVFRQFYYAFCMARAYDIALSDAFQQRLLSMVTRGFDLIKPNGRLAALGDTSRISPLLFDQPDLDSWCLTHFDEAKALLKSNKDKPRAGLSSAMYPKSGVAILRHSSPDEDAATESYFILRLSTFPTAHIHRDVFSFELFAFGQDLIVDSGGPFAYGHPIRDKYFLTTRAHNTVVVDGMDQAIGESKVIAWRTSKEWDLLVAEHENYPGVTHRRAVLFIKPAIFIVIDKLCGDGVRDHSQLFHLAPELTVNLGADGISTTNIKGGPTLKLVPLIREGLGLQLHRGIESPYQGWICTAGQRMEPNSVIDFSRRGKEVRFATLIVAEPAGKPTEVSGSMQGRFLCEEDVTFEISLDGRRSRFVVPTDGGLIQEAL